VRVCPEGCPTRPAREMNPERAGTGRAWPALNFPSAPHTPQLRELAFVEMQSCPRASSRALGWRDRGRRFPLIQGGTTFFLGDTVMTEKFAPPEVTIRRYPASRICDVVGCGSRPGNGSPLPQLLNQYALARNMGTSVQMLDFTGTPQIEQWQLTLRRTKASRRRRCCGSRETS
jgi:hypothetical protein